MQTGYIVSLLEVIGVAVVTGCIVIPESCGQGPVKSRIWRIECGKENHTGQTIGPLRIGVKEVSSHPIGPYSRSLPSGR